MKILRFIACMILFTASVFAVPVTFQWDPMPEGENWQAVRVYNITDPATPILVCESTSPLVNQCQVADVQSGQKFIARSWDGVFESGDSNTYKVGPSAPNNLKGTAAP